MDGCCGGGLKLKPAAADLSADEKEPNLTSASCSGRLNAKPPDDDKVWELSVLAETLDELSTLVEPTAADDSDAGLKPNDGTPHVAGGLKLNPTTEQL